MDLAMVVGMVVVVILIVIVVVIAIVVVSVVVIVGGVVLWFLCLVEVYVDVDCGGDAGINYASRAVASPFRADFAEHCVQIALLPLD